MLNLIRQCSVLHLGNTIDNRIFTTKCITLEITMVFGYDYKKFLITSALPSLLLLHLPLLNLYPSYLCWSPAYWSVRKLVLFIMDVASFQVQFYPACFRYISDQTICGISFLKNGTLKSKKKLFIFFWQKAKNLNICVNKKNLSDRSLTIHITWWV